jgi:hypothetical protein
MSDLQQHQTEDPVLRPIIENKQTSGAAPDSRTQRVWAQYNLRNNVIVGRQTCGLPPPTPGAFRGNQSVQLDERRILLAKHVPFH